MLGLVVCVAKYEWYIVEISCLFVGVGIVSALLGHLSLNQTTDAIIEGARSMVSVAVMLALARAIVVIASDGKNLDTVLHGIALIIGHLHPLAAVEGMFVAHSFLNFFIASGSGQAVLTMPVMIPLSDLMHIILLSYQTPLLTIHSGTFTRFGTNCLSSSGIESYNACLSSDKGLHLHFGTHFKFVFLPSLLLSTSCFTR